MIYAIAVKYAGYLIAAGVIVGVYYYWESSIESERDKIWIERDRQDIEHSKLLQAENKGKIAEIKKQYEDHNERELAKYNDYIKTLTTANVAANNSVNKLQRHSERKVDCVDRVSPKTNDTGGVSGSGAEAVQIAQSLKAIEIIMEDYVSKYFEIK